MKQTRIDLTEREWQEIRVAAVIANVPVSVFLARLVRQVIKNAEPVEGEEK